MKKLADYTKEHDPLTPGEEALLAGLASGEPVPIGGEGLPPADASGDRVIRGTFLREILLGSFQDLADFGARLHEKGVQLAGARITGVLDLEGCRIERDVRLIHCRFENALVLSSTLVKNLSLNGSAIPGIKGDRLEVRGDFFLCSIDATGKVGIPSAKMNGNFFCSNASFDAGGGKHAFSAHGAEVQGRVVLSGLSVKGKVQISDIKVRGNLECEGGQLRARPDETALSAERLDVHGSVVLRNLSVTGATHLTGASIGRELDLSGSQFLAHGRAMAVDGATIHGSLFMRDGTGFQGLLDLSGAEVGHLCDAEACWPSRGQLALDGFRYGALTGTGTPVDAASRIRWLDLQNPALFGQDFWPQSWEQCAKVLREMGHRGDARTILIEKEKRQRAAARGRPFAGDPIRLVYNGLLVGAFAGISAGASFGLIWATPAFVIAALITMLRGWREIADWLLGLSVDYGHRPLKAFAWLAGFWLIGLFVFAGAESQGAIKPNQPIVLRGAEWVGCARPDPAERLACFLETPAARSYPAFNAAVYSIDTLLPIVDLEMQGYWIPDDRASAYGAFARGYLWLHIGLGWALSLLAVAGFSGLIRSDSKT